MTSPIRMDNASTSPAELRGLVGAMRQTLEGQTPSRGDDHWLATQQGQALLRAVGRRYRDLRMPRVNETLLQGLERAEQFLATLDRHGEVVALHEARGDVGQFLRRLGPAEAAAQLVRAKQAMVEAGEELQRGIRQNRTFAADFRTERSSLHFSGERVLAILEEVEPSARAASWAPSSVFQRRFGTARQTLRRRDAQITEDLQHLVQLARRAALTEDATKFAALRVSSVIGVEVPPTVDQAGLVAFCASEAMASVLHPADAPVSGSAGRVATINSDVPPGPFIGMA